MSEADGASFFAEFNAKYLDPEEVASGYVYSKHFGQLSGPYNAVLIGPRGSGKTTLLKMLQPAALDAWQGRRAQQFREKIKYSGVFVASDISWSRQLNALGYGKLSADNHRVLVLACFTTHVIHAVLEAMLLRMRPNAKFRAVHLESNQEGILAKELLAVLKLSAPLGTLLSVKQALRSRLSEVRVLANRGSLQDQSVFQKDLAELEWLHLDFLDVASNITSLFNDAANEGTARWALLFDELETAPDWIVEQLFEALRVSNPRVFLKLAISPVSPTAYKKLLSVDGPADGQDFRQIPLWYTDKVDAKDFCESVWRALTKKVNISVSAREALGPSYFEPATPRQIRHRNPYSPGEHWSRVFASLKEKDKSFGAFLRARNIDLGRIGHADQGTRDAVLRKAAPVAAVRNFFLHEDRLGNVYPKQRKTSSLYAGAESIFAISEGNPRWLIGLLTPMISYMTEHRVKRVPESVQAEEIDRAAERLIALLRTIPVPAGKSKGVLGLNGLVEKIGMKLHDDLMERNFSLDPRLSFTVDAAADALAVELLASGLNRGAVILVSGTPATSVVGDLTGVVLRLSYLLAAKYGLPLRKGKTTHLSLLLSKERKDVEGRSQLHLSGL